MGVITSNQRFTTKPKVSIPLKFSDKSWESTNLPTILPVQSKISIAHERRVEKEEPKVMKLWESLSTRPNIPDNLIPQVSTTTQPSRNNKYTRHTSHHIGNNIHSQNLSSVLEITNNNNNNYGDELIKYLQMEIEPQQLPSHSDWIYSVIQFVNLLCLLKLLSQQNTSRNNIVIYSDTLSCISNKFQNQTRSSQTSYQIRIHSIIFCSTYRI